jgi:tetratricopeptide (TPR) repeat protein
MQQLGQNQERRPQILFPPETLRQEGVMSVQKVCASCHSNIYSSFRQTSMGLSMLPEKAIKTLEKARSSSPYFREVYEMLASDHMTLGQYGDALAVLRQGIELFPDDVKLRALEKRANSVTLGPVH